MAKYNPQDYQDGFYRAKPGFSPQTGEGENWDGTSHGAIEDMLMDTDGDGDWDDFEGDGMPDDKV